MKKHFAILLSLTGFFLLSSLISPNEWVKWEKDTFTILFPQAPQLVSNITKTALGDMAVKEYSYETPETTSDSNALYQVVETDYPPEAIKLTSETMTKGFWNGVVKGATQKLGGKLLSVKEIVIGGYPARALKIDVEEGLVIVTMKMVLVKEKVFAVQTIALAGKENNRNATKFFDSFQIK